MLNHESNLELFLVWRKRVSLRLCIRKINMMGLRCQFFWLQAKKPKTKNQNQPISVYFRQKGHLFTYCWSSGEGRSKHWVQRAQRQLLSCPLVQLPTFFLCLSSTLSPLLTDTGPADLCMQRNTVLCCSLFCAFCHVQNLGTDFFPFSRWTRKHKTGFLFFFLIA